MKKLVSFLIACVLGFGLLSVVGCANNSPSVLTLLSISNNSSVILDVMYQDNRHEDMDFSGYMDVSEYKEVEIRLYADQGYDFAVTKKKPAKMIILSSSGEQTIDMTYREPHLNGNFNTPERACCTGTIKNIPAGNFSISIDAITYRWTAAENFDYIAPTKMYRTTNSGSEEYSGSDKKTLMNTFLNEMYIRFEGEYNFGYGNDEIQLVNFVNNFGTGNNVNCLIKSNESIVLYAYAHKSNENLFNWGASVYVADFAGEVDEEIYETEEYIGKKYIIRALLPDFAVIKFQPYILKTWN